MFCKYGRSVPGEVLPGFLPNGRHTPKRRHGYAFQAKRNKTLHANCRLSIHARKGYRTFSSAGSVGSFGSALLNWEPSNRYRPTDTRYCLLFFAKRQGLFFILLHFGLQSIGEPRHSHSNSSLDCSNSYKTTLHSTLHSH